MRTKTSSSASIRVFCGQVRIRLRPKPRWESLRESVAIPRPRLRPEFSAGFKVIQSVSKRFKPKKEKNYPKPTSIYEPKWKNRPVARADSRAN
jgi:hypothetical protein